MVSIVPAFGYGPSYGFGAELSSTLDIGITVANGGSMPVEVKLDPREEYVLAAGLIDPDENAYDMVEGGYGGAFAWHGVDEYYRMYHTPAVGSAFNALRTGVLSNSVNLLPAIKPRLAPALPGQTKGTQLEEDMAAEICESNRRLLDAWTTPVDMVLWEMMEDMFLGHVMAEIVAEDVDGGPDDGLLAIKAIKPKPRSTYQFRVDRAFNVIGVRALSFKDKWRDPDLKIEDVNGRPVGDYAEMKLYEGEALKHFTWSTWDSYRGDPRGRSCFRMAHYHWKMLQRLWPEVWKGWEQFGVPWLYCTTAPGAKMVPTVGKDGKPLSGPSVTAEYAMAMNGQRMRNGRVAAGPYDSKMTILESQKDASVASSGISILEGQITKSILLQIRATTEAKHGSKADSEVGQDIKGTLERFVRKTRERWLRSVLIRQNEWNYGIAVAKRLTPLVDLGGTEHQDFAANASGVATLFQSAYFTKSQLPYVDTFLGLPQRQPGDDRVGPQGIMSDHPVDPNAAQNAAEPSAKEAA
jgi:hypothetical protein